MPNICSKSQDTSIDGISQWQMLADADDVAAPRTTMCTTLMKLMNWQLSGVYFSQNNNGVQH